MCFEKTYQNCCEILITFLKACKIFWQYCQSRIIYGIFSGCVRSVYIFYQVHKKFIKINFRNARNKVIEKT